MPCHLPDDLSCVTDDVFSYMCSLAMEKCSKKSEKKKASCGGAAMRKRLLIKNFVSQMLAQERQNSNAYLLNVHNNKGKFEPNEMDDSNSPKIITVNNGVILNNSMEVDFEDEEDEDYETSEQNYFTSMACSSTIDQYQQLHLVNSIHPPNNVEDVEDEEEDEDDDEDDEDDGEMESEKCSASSSNQVLNNFCSLNGETCSNLMNNSSNVFMQHVSPVTSHFGGVLTGQFDDNMSLSAVACSSICAPPLYSTTHFYDSTGIAMTATPVPGSSSSNVELGSRSSEWEDFHTVPPSSNDENLHCQDSFMYSMYQPYPITSASNILNSSLQFHHQQLASSSVCSVLSQDSSTLTSACTMGSLTINDRMPECHQSTNIKSDIRISNCDNLTNSYSSVESLPENFLDDSLASSSASKTTSNDVGPDLIWGSDNKKNNINMCFWDDNNNNSDRKNDDLIYGGLSGIPQHIIVSSSSPPPPSSVLHSLVTMVPSMAKLSNCRTEAHQVESSYRRCITDLDTNTVVEEDYNSSISSAFHLNSNQHNNSYFPRKRSLSPFFIEHLGMTQQEFLDDGSMTASIDSSSGNMYNFMMLNQSPKRVKL